jgi:hypothetical protein
MKKTIVVICWLLLCIFNNGYTQTTLAPQFYGTYMVIENSLNELTGSIADSLSGVGFIGNTLLGVKNVKGSKRKWINDDRAYFIVYQKELKEQPVLAKVEYKSKVSMKNSATGQDQEVAVGMFVPTKFINLRMAPLEGKEGALKLIPEFPLENGWYVFDLRGRIKTNDAFAFTQEQNSKNDIWSFIVTTGGCVGYGKLSDFDITKEEYTVPPSFGMWIVNGFNYAQVPVHRKTDIKEAEYNGEDYEVLAASPTVSFSKDDFRNFFVIFSEKDRRAGEKSTAYINYVPYKDMWPEKMFFSKLKEIEVDMRTKREKKKNEPQKMEKVWISEKEIQFDISNNFDGRLSKITLKENLEPGVYAFHNGGINGVKTTYGFAYNVVYSFEIK